MVQALSAAGGTVAIAAIIFLVRWIAKVHEKANSLSERVAKLEGWVENEEGRRE